LPNRRLLWTLYLSCSLLLLLLWPGTAAAAPVLMTASGGFTRTSFTQENVRQIDGITLFDFTETDTLTGTFEGSSVIHGSCIVRATGAGTCLARETFTGKVAGKTGTVEFQDFITLEPSGAAHGRFVIVGGTGELANLRGSGSFEGTPEGTGTYTGQIVFLG
jgi:hypothetical protein